MKSEKDNSHGGARPGAGRRAKAGLTIVKRLPVALVPAVDAMIAQMSAQGQPTARLPLDVMLPAASPPPASIPLANDKIPAGFPSPAEPYISEYLDFNQYLVRNPEATFVARSGGQSMFDAGIDIDDLLVIDRSLAAKHRDIVMADLGNEFTIKRLYKHAGRIELHSENAAADYPNFIPAENDIWTIVGVVTHIIKAVKR